jgi:signal transduction histidine kinase/CheY-like chemotaxis protein
MASSVRQRPEGRGPEDRAAASLRRRQDSACQVRVVDLPVAALGLRRGKISIGNPAAESLFGYPSGGLTGKATKDLLPDLPTTLPPGTVGLCLRARRGDGGMLPVTLGIAPNTGVDGLTVVVVQDASTAAEAATQRARLEHELHRSQRLESLGQLVGGVAHDCNNVMAVILSSAALIDEDLTEMLGRQPNAELATLARDVRKIRQAGERVAALTRQLLTFASREELRPELIDLNEVVSDVGRLLAHTLGDDIKVSVSVAGELPKVHVDAGRIEQALINLALNARDAMPRGGVVSLTTSTLIPDPGDVTRPAGRYAVLEVTDTGAGMPPDVVERAFEPFFTTKTHRGGTGLGLASVHGAVTQAGGAVAIDSYVGEGTTVTIWLPAATSIPLAGRERDSGVDGSERPTAQTILLLDDEEELRAIIERILRQAGYTVLAARSGTQALQLAERHEAPIDLLLSDVTMPGMAGPEVATKLRQRRPGIPIVFMSGYLRDLLATGTAVPSDVILIEKPFTKAGLLEKVATALRGDS